MHGILMSQISKRWHYTVPESIQPRNYYRVSDTFTCPLRHWHVRTGEIPSDPPKAPDLFRMSTGDVLHDFIRRIVIPSYTDYTVTCWEPEELMKACFTVNKQDIWLHGKADGLLIHRKTGEPALLEIKSTSTFGYRGTLKANFQDPYHYSMSYVKQAIRYCGLWNKAMKGRYKQVSQYVILIVNRNADMDKNDAQTVQMMDYWFHYDKQDFESDLAYLAMVQKQIKQGQPSRLDKPGVDCDLCTRKTRCWGGSPISSTGESKTSEDLQQARTICTRKNVSPVPKRGKTSNRNIT